MLLVIGYFTGLAAHAFFGGWAWVGLLIVALGVHIYRRYMGKVIK